MNNNNFTDFILASSRNIRIVFVLLFVIFGLIIAFISFFVSTYYENKSMNEELITSSKSTFTIQESILQNRIKSYENILFSLSNSKIFNSYLSDKNLKTSVDDIFATSMNTNDELMQVRYLNQEGQEVLRIERKSIGASSYIAPENKLQNKSDRYYFKEVKSLAKGDIWISKIDLNMESGKIVKPLTPTLRLSTPIYNNNQFRGTIIVNVFMEQLLNELTKSPLFDISIIDKNGDYIYKIDTQNDIIKDYSWSKYLKKGLSLTTLSPLIANNILNSQQFYSEDIFSKKVSNIFYNPDELIFIYQAKKDKLEQMKKKKAEYMITISIIIFFISIPIAFVISYKPVKLSQDLIKTQKNLSKERLIVDKYVATSTTDTKGIITAVSKAFCEMTGYDKEELIGSSHNIIASQDNKIEVYQKLWDKIINTDSYKGEIKNINKNGNEFWINLNINAMRNTNGDLVGYHSYNEDITNSKRLLEISITDGLTSLYNRRYFDEVFPKEIKISKRIKSILVFALIDIDHFKQYNDTYGHQSGDTALKRVANGLNGILKRPNDYTFRLGGEEFGLLYNVTNKDEGINIANKVRESIEQLNIEHVGNSASKFVTISMGIYIIDIDDVATAEEIYKKSDEALYVAKENGRNQVSIAKS